MKRLHITFVIAILLGAFPAEAQLIKKIGERAESAAERTVLNKTDQKTSQKVGKGIDDAVDGKPSKREERKRQRNERKRKSESNNNVIGTATTTLAGKWSYVSVTGLQLDSCGKKSHLSFSGNNYTHLVYGKDCTPILGDSGTFQIKGSQLILSADKGGKTTTYTILSQNDTELILKETQTDTLISLRKA